MDSDNVDHAVLTPGVSVTNASESQLSLVVVVQAVVGVHVEAARRGGAEPANPAVTEAEPEAAGAPTLNLCEAEGAAATRDQDETRGSQLQFKPHSSKTDSAPEPHANWDAIGLEAGSDPSARAKALADFAVLPPAEQRVAIQDILGLLQRAKSFTVRTEVADALLNADESVLLAHTRQMTPTNASLLAQALLLNEESTKCWLRAKGGEFISRLPVACLVHMNLTRDEYMKHMDHSVRSTVAKSCGKVLAYAQKQIIGQDDVLVGATTVSADMVAAVCDALFGLLDDTSSDVRECALEALPDVPEKIQYEHSETIWHLLRCTKVSNDARYHIAVRTMVATNDSLIKPTNNSSSIHAMCFIISTPHANTSILSM